MRASRGLARVFALVIAALAGGLAGAAAQSGDPPQLHTHQSYMEEVMRVTTLDVKDPLAVFAFVLNSLPDNFIEGETLRNAILKVQPNLKGQIDRFGGTPDGEVRYMIGPYLLYKQLRRIQARRPLRRSASRVRSRLLPLFYFRR